MAATAAASSSCPSVTYPITNSWAEIGERERALEASRRELIGLLNRARMLAWVTGSNRVVVGRDGWLFYDHHYRDPLGYRILGLGDGLHVTRRWFYWVPAMGENRMVAPAGNNALEYYLRILAKAPDDSGAKDALRELFPFATGSAEDQINQGNFDEATRIVNLLGP